MYHINVQSNMFSPKGNPFLTVGRKMTLVHGGCEGFSDYCYTDDASLTLLSDEEEHLYETTKAPTMDEVISREIRIENEIEQALEEAELECQVRESMTQEEIDQTNAILYLDYKKLSPSAQGEFVRNHPTFVPPGGWILPKKVSKQEADVMYNEFLALCREEDRHRAKQEHAKQLADERFQADSMNWLYHRNRAKFDQLAQSNGEGWFDVYCDEKRAEQREATLHEQQRVIAKQEEIRKQKLIRQGYCFCDANAEKCTCGGQRNNLNYHKKRKRMKEMAKRAKQRREAKKAEKIRQARLASRELFLKKKEVDDKRWKASIEYAQLVEKKKKREQSKNIIVIEEIESEVEDVALSPKETEKLIAERKAIDDAYREEQMKLLLDEIEIKEEKDRVDEMKRFAIERDERTWTTVSCAKKLPTVKPIRAKKTQVISIDLFNNNDYKCRSMRQRSNQRHNNMLLCTRVCVSIRAKRNCRFGKDCRFAHTMEQLRIISCRFNRKCRHGSTCPFKHSYESLTNYFKRQGFNVKHAKSYTSADKKTVPKNKSDALFPLLGEKKRRKRKSRSKSLSLLSYRDVLLGERKTESYFKNDNNIKTKLNQIKVT